MIHLIETDAHHDHLRGLIEELDAYLFQLYPPDEVFLVDFEAPSANDIRFVIAYSDNRPIGCGAIKPLDENSAELKRFYVIQDFRNRGIAGMMLDKLEKMARESGYASLKLETGEPQAEAVAFYRRHGYEAIERFGEYADCPSSLCYEKQL